MKTGLYYLNNHGSKWVILPKTKLWIKDYKTGDVILRTPNYFESFGNFASVSYSYKGKKESSLNYSENKEDL